MAEKRPPPRSALARNLKLLLEQTGMSAPDVAKRAGVDRKTINNQLNGRYDPRPEQVQAVAEVFGYNNWDLLNPSFDPSKKASAQLQQLLKLYGAADEKGQESIMRVAEMAASYKVK
jgi:transcriptional regulator with XRE-family HTH domain